MADRALAIATVVGVTLQVGFTAFGLPALECPVPRVTSSHCPGCGMTRSIEALMRGDWQASLTYHAFGPVLVLGFLLVCAAAFLPIRPRRRLVDGVARVESATGVTGIVLIGLVLYWGFRLTAGHGRIEALG